MSVISINTKKQTVTFKREFIKTGAVKINEVFLEGKVPLEAKYEFENYQKYLCDKYGL